MTAVKSQSFCGGQNGLTILAKIFFESLENKFDHLDRPFWPIFFWESYEFFVATMVNRSYQQAKILFTMSMCVKVTPTQCIGLIRKL